MFDSSFESSVSGVVFGEVDHVFQVDKRVVDCNYLNLIRLVIKWINNDVDKWIIINEIMKIDESKRVVFIIVVIRLVTLSREALKTSLPILPYPLIPTCTGAIFIVFKRIIKVEMMR